MGGIKFSYNQSIYYIFYSNNLKRSGRMNNNSELKFIFGKLYQKGLITQEEYIKSLKLVENGDY